MTVAKDRDSAGANIFRGRASGYERALPGACAERGVECWAWYARGHAVLFDTTVADGRQIV